MSKTKNATGYGSILSPYNTLPRSYPHFLAFDTETNSETGEMKCACLYGEVVSKDGKSVNKVELTFTDVKSLNDYIMMIGSQNRSVTTVVCFNLSFDIWYLFQSLDLGSILMNGGNVIVARTKSNIEIIDISNHSKGSLGDWVGRLNLGEKGIVKTEHPELMAMDELIVHCQHDVRATWELVEYFKRFYQDLGISFKLTLSSSAMDMYRRNFLTQKWMRKGNDEGNGMTVSDMEKLAYYGGRTECFTRGVNYIRSYDVNSMYVSVMRDEWYPIPDRYTFFKGSNVKKSFEWYYRNKHVRPNLMIIHCRVSAPKARVMVLPYREPKTGKLLFPWGEFEGWWTSPELKEAEKYGYTILKVYEFILYRIPAKLFEGYATFCYANRLKAIEDEGKGCPFDAIWKLMGNGVYGKFGEKHQLIRGFSESCPPARENQIVSKTIVEGRDIYTYSAPEEEFALTAFPCIAAFVTSYSRLKLLKYLKRHEDSVVYCDTDSIKYPFNEEPEPSSKELGEVKFEEDNSGNYIFLRPKMYGKTHNDFDDVMDYDFDNPSDKQIMVSEENLRDWKIKGLGKPLGIIINTQTLQIEGITMRASRLRQALRGGTTPNKFGLMNKTMDLRDDKRVWKGKDSEPLYIFDEEEL